MASEGDGTTAIAPSGKLELTWTNKHLRLLADEEGGYTWVSPSDYRVAEVRLLHDVETVGETRDDRSRAKDNLLIRGDALNALTSLCELPELAREYVGKVKLVYLDPPFNTKQAFAHYDDALEHSVWLTMMRDRLLQIRKLLAPDGSVWVHCDDSEQHRLRCVLDEVFGSSAWIATVVWQTRYSRDNRPAIGTVPTISTSTRQTQTGGRKDEIDSRGTARPRSSIEIRTATRRDRGGSSRWMLRVIGRTRCTKSSRHRDSSMHHRKAAAGGWSNPSFRSFWPKDASTSARRAMHARGSFDT